MEQPTDSGSLGRLLQADVVLSARLAVSTWFPKLLALFLAHSGDSPLWLAGAFTALLWGGPSWRSFGLRVVAATLAGSIVATLLKFLFRRSRPTGPYAALYSKVDRHAFPSGHATRAGCMAVTLAPILPLWGAGLLIAWAGLVSLARVALQVHYLLDVAVGLVLGALLGAVLLLVLF